MAKFDAGTAVERLEFDFTAYGGGKGVIEEPTTGRINTFFASMKVLVKDAKSLQNTAKGLEQDFDVEEMDEDTLTDQLSKVDEAEAKASNFQQRTIENLAILCGANWDDTDPDGKISLDQTLVGGSPTFDDLNKLPYRVLQAFSQWLMEEIKPKKTTPGTKR